MGGAKSRSRRHRVEGVHGEEVFFYPARVSLLYIYYIVVHMYRDIVALIQFHTESVNERNNCLTT